MLVAVHHVVGQHKVFASIMACSWIMTSNANDSKVVANTSDFATRCLSASIQALGRSLTVQGAKGLVHGQLDHDHSRTRCNTS